MKNKSFTLAFSLAISFAGFFGTANGKPLSVANTQPSLEHAPVLQADKLLTRRPPVEQRLFRSEAVERKIAEVCGLLKEQPYLAWMFENCFPNTLDTTVHYQLLEGDDDTFVYTGDIHAMWLRDSAAQVWPYLPLALEDARLQHLIRGGILRQLRCIHFDPYANAFNLLPTGSEWESDLTDMKPELHERKYEIDSLCYPVRLAFAYWQITGDNSIFGDAWHLAVGDILRTFRQQQRKDGVGPYRFMRRTERATDTTQNDGYGHPVRPVGLIASMFRPSDDACIFPFLVPSNFFAVSILRKIVLIENYLAEAHASANGSTRASSSRDAQHSFAAHTELAAEAKSLADEVDAALHKYAVCHHPKYGDIYAYEVDGYGNQLLMDDANVPSLLSLPYIADVDVTDSIYQNTRRFVLSPDNPYFFRGKAGEGIGGPHIGMGYIWPMSIIMRALTSTDDEEIDHCLQMLQRTDGGTGFIHESFHQDDASRFTRKWFAWANTLFGELVLKRYGRERGDGLRLNEE